MSSVLLNYALPILSARSYLPNLLTLCNLLCGCIGLVFVADDTLATAAYLIWVAAAFDFADGLIARAFKAYSEVGKQLDSLADMVSFGVLPSYILFALIDAQTTHALLPFIGFLVAAFSALRLAIFNVDTRQTHAFIGVPTPANALLISSFPLILKYYDHVSYVLFLHNPWILTGLTLLLSYLLVARIELLAFKFKQTTWRGNEVRYLFMIATPALFILLKVAAIPVIFVLYLGISLVNSFFIKKA